MVQGIRHFGWNRNSGTGDFDGLALRKLLDTSIDIGDQNPLYLEHENTTDRRRTEIQKGSIMGR